MQKKQIIILGAGISGLSLAYFLSKRGDCDIRVFEKKERAGGWIRSDMSKGFLFEEGPRTFLFSKCVELRALATELGLEKELVFSHDKGKGRYLWMEGKLRKVPIWTGAFVKSLLKEWRVHSVEGDESIWDFACRRFNPKVAMHFFDPMVTGIYAGDMRKLSIEACFPTLKKWEKTWGSITKGLWKMKKSKGPFLFSFARGVQSFLDELEKKSRAEFHYGEEITGVEFKGNRVVVTGKEKYEADYLFSALPSHVAGKLLDEELLDIAHTSATVVNLGYHKSVLDKSGYGYIVSSQESEDVLGVVFDSNAFPREEEGTRLTVMLKKADLKEEEALDSALQALRRHLNITLKPDVTQVVHAKEAFPQMNVGHLSKMQAIEKRLKEKHPNLRLVGNYLYGVGVEDCVLRAKSVSESFFKTVDS